MINQLLIIVFAYLIGSISTGIITSRFFNLPDPRTMGSKNPGATNVMRTGNKKAAIFTLVGDLLKATFVLLIASNLGFDGYSIIFVSLAVLIGHIFPIYYNFRGGKGVATAVGILITLNFKLALIVVCIWIFVFLIFRYSSLAAIVASISAPLIGIFIFNDQSLNNFTYVMVTSIILMTHQKNIKNLISGKELKFKKRS